MSKCPKLKMWAFKNITLLCIIIFVIIFSTHKAAVHLAVKIISLVKLMVLICLHAWAKVSHEPGNILALARTGTCE